MKTTINRCRILICALLVITGCSSTRDDIQRIALLAPFEGHYREVGYDAYYAVRLAMQEHDTENIELLAIDDGGSENDSVARAAALANDPLVKVVIVLGNNATKESVQQGLENKPVLIVGQWHSKPASDHVYVLANSRLAELSSPLEELEELTASLPTSKLVGSEIFALQKVPLLMSDLSLITVISSASLPDDRFRQRYVSSGQFVSEPGLLATLTYDAAGIALDALETKNPTMAIATMTYKGLNGEIRFVDGYWANAPINYFVYDAEGKLTPEDRPIK